MGHTFGPEYVYPIAARGSLVTNGRIGIMPRGWPGLRRHRFGRGEHGQSAIGTTSETPSNGQWTRLKTAGHAVGQAGHALTRHDGPHPPRSRRSAGSSVADLREVLAKGLRDFGAYRTDVIFLCVIYPLVGLILALFCFNYDFVPLLFPLASGFALLGPVAAVGLYEMSRRREQGAEVNWADAFGVLATPAFGAILVLGLMLLGDFPAMAGDGLHDLSRDHGPRGRRLPRRLLPRRLHHQRGWGSDRRGHRRRLPVRGLGAR